MPKWHIITHDRKEEVCIKEQTEYFHLIGELRDALDISLDDIRIYENSLCSDGESILLMAKIKGQKKLIVYGSGSLYDDLSGDPYDRYKICGLTHDNRRVINKHLSFTRPRAFGRNTPTMGLGDRLGMVSAAHCKGIQNRKIKPILAQQSMRELHLTRRTYQEVLDDVCFLVLQEGYRGGFGADGDHLKEEKDINTAIESGYTMITLDCSDRLGKAEDALAQYQVLSGECKRYYEEYYLAKNFPIYNTEIAFTFSKQELAENIAVYGKAIDFIEEIYKKHIQERAGQVDFEISLDETDNPTSLLGHFFVGEELKRRRIDIASMAPRFIGEFQKGIDYIGDLEDFERNFRAHGEIADHFGYKLSIHSGSDKFRVFQTIGKHTKGRFHIKTSGTNWLEAVKVIAKVHPALFRRMYKLALERFEEARAYYYVTTDTESLTSIDKVADDELVSLFGDNNIRQLLHITYGMMLEPSSYSQEIFATLHDHEEVLEETIIQHIGRHLTELGY